MQDGVQGAGVACLELPAMPAAAQAGAVSPVIPCLMSAQGLPARSLLYNDLALQLPPPPEDLRQMVKEAIIQVLEGHADPSQCAAVGLLGWRCSLRGARQGWVLKPQGPWGFCVWAQFSCMTCMLPGMAWLGLALQA
jgi:hypothetical protein